MKCEYESASQFSSPTTFFNARTKAALVALGTVEQEIAAEEKAVAKPGLEENGMYQLKVSSTDAKGGQTLCHDSYLRGDPKSRQLLFLLPGKPEGIRVIGLPFFGPPD